MVGDWEVSLAQIMSTPFVPHKENLLTQMDPFSCSWPEDEDTAEEQRRPGPFLHGVNNLLRT